MNVLSVEERRQRAHDLHIVVDEQDQWLIDNFTWRISTKGYVETTVYIPEKRTVKLHHLVVGRPLFDLQVDHVDKNKRNNVRSNLQFVSNQQNQLNTDRVEYASGIKLSRSGKFEARSCVGGYKHLGTYATREEAERVIEDYKSRSDRYTKVED